MFEDIEKEYRRGLQDQRFRRFYWWRAGLVVVAAIIIHQVFKINFWIIYGIAVIILVGLIIRFFGREFRVAYQGFPEIQEAKGIVEKLRVYFAADDAMRIENLTRELKTYNIYTKENLKLALDYYQSRLPVVQRPNVLEWVITTVITLSSIVVVAYDDEIGAINFKILFAKFSSALMVAAIIITPFLLTKIISAAISKSRNKIDTILVEDLAYLYVNFEKF